jgi:hypothetical protein
VACLEDDDFVVVYEYRDDSNGPVVPWVRRHHFAFAGTDVAADQDVQSSSPEYGSWQPRVTAYDSGSYYGVAWEDKFEMEGGGQDTDVYLRRFVSSTGSAVDTNQVAVGGDTDYIQGKPAVDVMQCSGGWVIGWQSEHLAGTGSNETFEVFGIFRND